MNKKIDVQTVILNNLRVAKQLRRALHSTNTSVFVIFPATVLDNGANIGEQVRQTSLRWWNSHSSARGHKQQNQISKLQSTLADELQRKIKQERGLESAERESLCCSVLNHAIRGELTKMSTSAQGSEGATAIQVSWGITFQAEGIWPRLISLFLFSFSHCQSFP